jgi:DNA-directed RNA polymerase beta subunit
MAKTAKTIDALKQDGTKRASFSGRRRIRKFFGHITEAAQMPNLIEVQKSSYDQFLMVEKPEGGRGDEGCRRFSGRCSRSATSPALPCSNSSITSSIRPNTTSRNAGSAT